MGNKPGKALGQNRHHECELFSGAWQHEGAESYHKWRNCTKNPEHKNFISAQDFKDNYLPQVQDLNVREALRSHIDLTVRLRVHYTSTERPDDDEFSHGRGHDKLRTGTGYIRLVSSPQINKPCPCVECGGQITKKHWEFQIRTAHHVVYNTEEAMETKVDLFLDDESFERDGAMKSIWGMKMIRCYPDLDRCHMLCVTCDESLGERIESAWRCCEDDRSKDLDLSGLDFPVLPSCDRDCDPALVVSHPHGQPKKITVGEWGEEEYPCVNYSVPTCHGSSGAPVFRFRYKEKGRYTGLDIIFFSPVHSGSYDEISQDHENQRNFGFDY